MLRSTKDALAGRTMQLEVARSIRSARTALGLTQREVGRRAGVSHTEIWQLEHASANPTVATLQAVAEALGADLRLELRRPFIADRQRDAGHALCVGHVERRLAAADWRTATEVEVRLGRSRGWIDLLAFDRASGTMLVVEIKTWLDDLGSIERQLGWYERAAPALAHRRGWRVRRVVGWLLVLATDANDDRIRVNRDAFEGSFPDRAASMRTLLEDRVGRVRPRRGLAMIDPRSRRRAWLIATRLDGRRAPAPYADYAEMVRSDHPRARQARVARNE